MKGRILALITSLIVSGCAGLYANNAAKPQSSAAPESTTVSVTASSQDTTSAQDFSSKVSSEASSKPQTVKISVPKSSSSCPNSQVSSKAPVSSKPAASSQPSSSSKAASAPAANRTTTYQSLNDYINSLLNGSKNGTSCPKTPSSGGGSSNSSKPSSSAPSSGNSSAPSTGTGSGTYADFQNQVLQLVNQERTSRGLKALTMDSALNNTATLKSQDMAKLGYFDHTSPTYGSPFDMMKQFGISFRTAGENIAMGQTSPQQVMDGWMNSSGHRANILNSSYTKIGIGIARNSSGRYYWTQQFIG